MSYTAQPPEPPTTSREFKLVIRAVAIEPDYEALEKIIADAVAARLGCETTVDYEFPF